MATAALAVIEAPAAVAICTESAKKVQAYLDSARARNTVRSYRSSFSQFEAWCTQAGLSSLPASPETIALYLGAQAGRLKAASLQHHLSAIAKAHKTAGYPSPIKDDQLIAETLKGIRRTHGTAAKQKAPLLTDDIRMMLRYLPKNVLGVRDRALLLIGFAGAFRRSELVALNVDDIRFSQEGLLINLRRSKTDQDAEGRTVAIPYGNRAETCPVKALQTWLQFAGITEGAIFRPINRHSHISPNCLTDRAVARIIKSYARKVDLPVGSFSGHSLRAGFVTTAAINGEPERRIMRQTGHKSVEMVLKYVRQANAFTDNAALALGL